MIAFLGNPDWIILDEPFITLDVQSQEILADLMARVHDNGTSFLFATHQDILNTHVPKVMIYELIDGKLLKH